MLTRRAQHGGSADPEQLDNRRVLLFARDCRRIRASVLGQIVVADRPPGGAVEVVELAALQRP